MAADFVIGGPANSREFARAVALSDLLQRALPSYRARHVVKHESAWTDWVTATCEQMGFMDFTPVSIVVYRLLGEGVSAGAPVGYAPSITQTPRPVGDCRAFEDMAKRYYGIDASSIKEDDIDSIVEAHINECKFLDNDMVQPRTLGGSGVTVCIQNAECETAYLFLGSLVTGNVFGADRPVHLRLVASQDDASDTVNGIAMELHDCAHMCLGSVTCHAASDANAALQDADIAILFAGAVGVQENGGRCSEKTVKRMCTLGPHIGGNTKVVIVGEGCNAAAAVLVCAAEHAHRCDKLLGSGDESNGGGGEDIGGSDGAADKHLSTATAEGVCSSEIARTTSKVDDESLSTDANTTTPSTLSNDSLVGRPVESTCGAEDGTSQPSQTEQDTAASLPPLLLSQSPLACNVTTLTGILQARAAACVAHHLNHRVGSRALTITGRDVRGIVCWAGDTGLPVVDPSYAVVSNHGGVVGDGVTVPLVSCVRDAALLGNTNASRTLEGAWDPCKVLGWVCDRDALLQGPPAMVTARLLTHHLQRICGAREVGLGVADSVDLHSCGRLSTANPYGIADEIFFTFPVTASASNFAAHVSIPEDRRADVLALVTAAVEEKNRCLHLVGLQSEELTLPQNISN